MHLRNLIAVIIPLLGICLLLEALRAHGALSPVNNIDILEPIVRSSPALSESDTDFFGWATVIHQIQPPDSNDDLNEAVNKARSVLNCTHNGMNEVVGL